MIETIVLWTNWLVCRKLKTFKNEDSDDIEKILTFQSKRSNYIKKEKAKWSMLGWFSYKLSTWFSCFKMDTFGILIYDTSLKCASTGPGSNLALQSAKAFELKQWKLFIRWECCVVTALRTLTAYRFCIISFIAHSALFRILNFEDKPLYRYNVIIMAFQKPWTKSSSVLKTNEHDLVLENQWKRIKI